jgi:hypothetical protein
VHLEIFGFLLAPSEYKRKILRAISTLMDLVAQDLIPLPVISLLAKHKTAENALATTTVGYVQNQVASLKTQIATFHL